MNRRRCSVAFGVISVLAALSGCGGADRGMRRVAGEHGWAQTATKEYVVLVPRVLGGQGGWCVARPRSIYGSAMCEEAPGASPILTESWGATGSGESAVANGVAITTAAVANVSVEGGAPIPTRFEPALPDGLRTVSVELRVSAAGNKLVEFVLHKRRRRRFTPLDSRGGAIRQTGDESVISFNTPALTWLSSEPEPAGLCKMAPRSAGGLRALGGTVATRATSVNGVPGEPLLSCIDVGYGAGGTRLLASVLINAHRLGAAPGPLSNAQAIRGRPGLYRALGADGAMVARRIPDAWLAVSGGDSQAQRIALVTRLRATVGM
jgi:hypothetical protein